MTQTAFTPAIVRLERTYRASNSIVPLARSVIADQAHEWQVPEDIAHRVRHVCSELVTNAVGVSSAADHIKIRFEWFATCVLLSVWDCSPQAVRTKAPDLYVPSTASDTSMLLKKLDELPDTDPGQLPSLGGWGLNVVAALADAMGSYWPTPIPKAGKWTWARFEF